MEENCLNGVIPAISQYPWDPHWNFQAFFNLLRAFADGYRTAAQAAAQSQKGVTAYFSSEQLLLFSFARQIETDNVVRHHSNVTVLMEISFFSLMHAPLGYERVHFPLYKNGRYPFSYPCKNSVYIEFTMYKRGGGLPTV